MIARELLVKLGFNIDAAKLDKFSAMVDDTKKKMQSLKQNMTPEIVSRFNDLKAEHDEQKTWSRQEQADVKALNRLEKQAIKEVSSLESERAKEKQRQLKELQATAQNISKKVAMFGAGIAAGFGLSLRSTLKDAENFKAGKSKSSFSPQQIAEVDKFNNALESTKQLAADIRNSFITAMLPAINKVLIPFREWLKTNKAIIKGKLVATFETIGAVITGVAKTVAFVVKALGGFKRILSVVKLAIVGFGIFKFSQGLYMTYKNINLIKTALLTWTKISFKSLLSPVILISAALTGLFLILEDLYVYSKGGNSLIGDILNSEAVKNFTDMINNLLKALGLLEKRRKRRRASEEKQEVLKDNTDEEKGFKDKTRGGFFRRNQQDPRLIKKIIPVDLKANALLLKDIMDLQDARFRSTSPEQFAIANRQSAITSTPTINSSPTFNMTINVPAGTSQDITRTVADRVKEELEKFQEKLMISIGAH